MRLSGGRLAFVTVMLVVALWIMATGVVSDGSTDAVMREYEWTGRLFGAGLCVIAAIVAVLSAGSKSGSDGVPPRSDREPPR